MRMGLVGQPGNPAPRIGDNVINGSTIIDDPIDEGRVGSVLQQSPHQVRQQIFMTAHRRIDPARHTVGTGVNDLAIQRLAHSMQALEFEIPIFTRHLQHRGQGMSVVGGKLRIDGIAVAQQFPRAGDIRHIRRDLCV